jgi:uncharacterized membrane protein YccC
MSFLLRLLQASLGTAVLMLSGIDVYNQPILFLGCVIGMGIVFGIFNYKVVTGPYVLPKELK